MIDAEEFIQDVAVHVKKACDNQSLDELEECKELILGRFRNCGHDMPDEERKALTVLGGVLVGIIWSIEVGLAITEFDEY